MHKKTGEVERKLVLWHLHNSIGCEVTLYIPLDNAVQPQKHPSL